MPTRRNDENTTVHRGIITKVVGTRVEVLLVVEEEEEEEEEETTGGEEPRKVEGDI